jgi:NADH-quinone oxidoreductase subunit J
LAQQAGATNCDQNSRQPGTAAFLGFVLLGALLFVIVPSKEGAAGPKTGFVALAEPTKPIAEMPWTSFPFPSPQIVTPSEASVTSAVDSRSPKKEVAPQSTSVPTEGTYGSMRGLGRSLFGDYLFAVELAGTLLLIASIGAIVIAPKRSSGKL